MHQHTGHRPGAITKLRWLALALVFALVAAACGSDEADNDTTAADPTVEEAAPPATEEPAEEQTEVPVEEAPEDPTAEPEEPVDPPGDPIKIAFLSNWDVPAFGFSQPEKLAAAETAVAAINDSGGINGSPIELFTCNVAGDAATAEACARDAVAEGVVAVAGLATPTNGSAAAILEEAGIPIIGAPLEASIWASPVAFPLTAGIGVFPGMVAALGQAGSTKLRIVASDTGGAVAGAELFFRVAAAPRGLEVFDTVLVPPDQADMAAIVQAAMADEVDGLGVIIGSPAALVGLTRGLADAGYSGSIIVGDGPLNLDAMEQMGEGILVVAQLNLSSPGGEQFVAEMGTYAPDEDILPQAAIGWLAIHVIANVAAGLDEVTSESLIAALSAETALDLMGMANPIDFTTPVAALAPAGASRIFQTAVGVATIEGRDFLDGQLLEPFPPAGG